MHVATESLLYDAFDLAVDFIPLTDSLSHDAFDLAVGFETLSESFCHMKPCSMKYYYCSFSPALRNKMSA